MKFLDEARIEVKAGNGGAGMSHFRREKFIPLGGPDGGDGGNGGSVMIEADNKRQTLLDLHMHPVWRAEDGKKGGTNNRQGRSGVDVTIHVPVGTQIFKHGTEELVSDLCEDGMSFTIARGGRGGKGNTFFKSSTNQAPRHSQPGEEGEGGIYQLVLKLVADVGLVGLPNAGKSTLISRISAARPKIADYPFTTLTPNLGVVRYGEKSFVVADIPGLIPGAHEGKGLGIRFLKHVERTRLLVHLLDPTQASNREELFESFKLINSELSQFSPDLAAKPQILVITKADALTTDAVVTTDSDAVVSDGVGSRKDLEEVREEFRAKGLEPMIISSVTGEGVDEFIRAVGRRLFEE